MGTELLFDHDGDWIAFRVDDVYLYSPDGTLVGWTVADQGGVLVDRNGAYMADIVDNRLFRRTSPPFVANPGYLGGSSSASAPSNPGNVGYASLPWNYQDVPRDLLPGA